MHALTAISFFFIKREGDEWCSILRARPAHSAQRMRSRRTSCAQILPQMVVDCEVDHLAIVLLGIHGLSPFAPSGHSTVGRRLHVLGIHGLAPYAPSGESKIGCYLIMLGIHGLSPYAPSGESKVGHKTGLHSTKQPLLERGSAREIRIAGMGGWET